jgi:hypothetical protein
LFRQARTLHVSEALASHCRIGDPPFNRVMFPGKAIERVWRRAMTGRHIDLSRPQSFPEP